MRWFITIIQKVSNDPKTVSVDAFGEALNWLQLNLIVNNIVRHVDFLTEMFDIQGYRAERKFAKLKYGDQIFQLHANNTYYSHPLLRC